MLGQLCWGSYVRAAMLRQLKVAQINYVSRNQLHCTANFKFGLMYKKAKHCIAGLCQQTFHFCYADIFIWSCFPSCWIGAKIQIAVWQSDFMKWNLGGFTFISYPAVTYAAAEHQGHLFWITCKRLKLLRKANRLWVIQNLAPSVVWRRQCDIRMTKSVALKILGCVTFC